MNIFTFLFWDMIPKRSAYSNSPENLGVGRSKVGVPGHIYPDIKGQWLNLHFSFKTAKPNRKKTQKLKLAVKKELFAKDAF